MQKKDIYGDRLIFTGLNIMQRCDPMKLSFESVEMQKQNIPTDKPQREDEKTESSFQLSLLLPGLWSLKCQKWLYFVFSADEHGN